MESTLRGVCMFGAYDEHYPRNRVLRRGLWEMGIPMSSCRVSRRLKVAARYPALAARYLGMERPFDVVLVPEFRHKDVPLAALLAQLGGKLLVFDPLVSRFDTRVRDRGDARDGSFQAWHNRNIDSWSMSLADLVLADTRAHADYYRREFAPPDAAVRVLPVGYNDAIFTGGGPERDHGDGVVRVLFYGNYLPLHGADTIVRAAGLLRDDRRIAFELIGRGQTYGAVERYARSHALDNVTFEPRVPIDELPRRVADAAVCLGIFGATDKALRVVPNKVYQCMGMDRPVVTLRSPATCESLVDGVHAELVPPADEHALAAAIRRLVDDPERRRRMGWEAGRLARAQFRSRRIAERFVELCAEAMGGRQW